MMNLNLPRDRIHSSTGIITRTARSVLFIIPWKRHWIVGTTDTDWELDKAHPAASRTDIDYILDHVNTVLAHPLTHDDIEGVYAGLRPLLSGEADSTSKLSREHAVVEWTGDTYSIRDLDSSNGTFVNGERLANARVLHPADGYVRDGEQLGDVRRVRGELRTGGRRGSRL